MLATKAALASGGITHCCLRCGLRMFFLAFARSCCRWRARQCAVRRPSPRAGAGSNGRNPPGPERVSVRSALLPPRRRKCVDGRNWDCIYGSTLPRTLPRPAGAWSARYWRCWCPAPRQSGCRSNLRPHPTRPPSRECAPSSAAAQNLTFADQLIELGTFLRGQPHYVLLDGDLFPGHESPPSLACGDRDSEVAVIFNDGGD